MLGNKMILVCFGTRPEYIKVLPLIKKMDGVLSYKTFFTGQHEDLLRGVGFDYRLRIKTGTNRLDSIIASVMNSIDFEKENITRVLVQGDTTSALAVALSAFNHRIPVIHLEAGLRTYDLEQPFPEEANRQVISRIATLHLCPTELCKQRLCAENVQGKIKVVGNTVLDNLVDVKPNYTNNVVVTIHRRDNHATLQEWFRELNKLAAAYSDLVFTLPLHPNPNITKHKNLLSDINVVEPMAHSDFIELLAKSKIVITDSGGLQEEASFLKKKVIVCREKTERVESLGEFTEMCAKPRLLPLVFDKVMRDYIPTGTCPFGDGHAAEKIVDLFLEDNT